ncbi:MAG: ABC transporter permease [Bacteroidota bacterium]
MIQHYIKTALRNLWKFKGYSIINILGLTIGMACVILIMLFVNTERSFDNFHTNKDRIYRLNLKTTNPRTGEVNERAVGPYRLAKELSPDFPDFSHIIRFAPQGRETVRSGDQRFNEEQLTFVDPSVFAVFDFSLLRGNPATALKDPFSMVVTEDIARKYFGNLDPIGQSLEIRERQFEITGILAEIPQNSRFQFNMMVSMESADQVFSRIVLENWGEGYCETYVMVPPNKTPTDFADRLTAFIGVKLESWKAASPQLVLQALPNIYLHSQDISSYASGGDITYVYAFSFLALFILLIACINFMNLATARSSLRAKEVGMRKVVGATRGQLIAQFLGESTFLALIALLLAISTVNFVLPAFNSLADRQIVFDLFEHQSLILTLLGITLFVGLAAGSYPALLLSSFRPISVFSGTLRQGMKGGLLRKVLVAFQFAISIFLLVVTGVIYQQLNYCKNIKLGFDKNHLVVLVGTPITLREQYDSFQAELLSDPRIVNAAASSRVPPGRLSSNLGTRPEGVPEDQRRGMQTVWTDFDMIETLGLELAAGRSFDRTYPTDAQEAFVINEAAVKALGWTNESAINKTFGSSEIKDWEVGQWENRDGRVIGVLKDFHFESLKDEIVPTVYFIAPYMAWNYVVRIQGEDIPGTIATIEQAWKKRLPEVDFNYKFVDENFSALYENEERQGKIFGLFALFAIFVACLGLLGLASFTAEQKRKEVGIRKILGATSFNILYLLSKEITWLVLIAFCVAIPLAWYLMQSWLADFAYQVTLGVSIFLFAGLTAILIAWLTVGLQTARTALSNPADALRHE